MQGPNEFAKSLLLLGPKPHSFRLVEDRGDQSFEDCKACDAIHGGVISRKVDRRFPDNQRDFKFVIECRRVGWREDRIAIAFQSRRMEK